MIDITAAWRSSHAHLKPYSRHLPLSPDQHYPCPGCSFSEAYHVVADLYCTGDIKINRASVLYCPACDIFTIASSALPGNLLPEVTPVVSVDARLWAPPSTFINIEPTTRCNFRCWYCIGRHMEQRDMQTEDFAKILANIPSIKSIALVGEGEPLLHPDFFKMVEMATDAGKKVVILSNGSLLNETTIPRLCASGVAYISISLDSTDPVRFAHSRPNGNLNEILRNMANLRKFRDANGYSYPKIAIKGTLFDYSKDELPAIVALAQEHGAELFESFQPINPKHSYVEIYPEEHKGQLACAPMVSQAITRDSELARQSLRFFEDFFSEEGIEFSGGGRANGLRSNCDEYYAYALLSGDVTPCCQVKTPLDPEWNLIQHSLDEIVQHEQYENMRFNLWNGIFPEYCSGCWKTPALCPSVTGKRKEVIVRSTRVLHVEDRPAIRQLFQKVFRNDLSDAMLEWKYGDGRGTSYGVFSDEGRLLAHCGIFYRSVLADGQLRSIVQLGDLMALPGRHGGLARDGSPFALLIQKVLADLPGPANPDGLAFGFPSDRAMRLGEHLGLFTSIDTMWELSFVPLSSSWTTDRCTAIRPSDKLFAPVADRLWQQMAAGLGGSLIGIRDAAYLKQRYFSHPVNSYCCYLVSSRWLGRPLGMLITRMDGPECELLDIIAAPSNMTRLLQTARGQMAAWGVDVMKLWLTKRNVGLLSPQAEVVKPLEFRIMANPFSSNGHPERFAGRWWLTSGDTDYR